IIFIDWHSPIADIRELDAFGDPEVQLDGIINKLLYPDVAMYRLVCGQGKHGRAHRAPNFQIWLNRVPERCRVVILVVTPLTRFDENAILDLGAAVRRLHDDHKKLILSGIT